MITVLTLTGDRPEAFALCERWMAAQERQPDRWVVVDDGKTPTQCTRGQTVLRLPEMDGHSLARNLAAAIDSGHLNGAVAFVEDDDYYAARYLRIMEHLINSAEIAGETRAVYYHVGARKWQQMRNTDRASLCQTVVRASLLPTIRQLCASGDPFIDLKLWKLAATHRVVAPGLHPMVVGIKGMPGRRGIGIGHDASRAAYQDDADLSKLRSMIGNDAEVYAGFLRDELAVVPPG
jgi:hypothetical protein